MRLSKYEEAIECFDKAIELNPNNSKAYYGKGFILKNQNKYKEALEIFEKSIELDASDCEVNFQKACALIKLDKNEKSIKLIVTKTA